MLKVENAVVEVPDLKARPRGGWCSILQVDSFAVSPGEKCGVWGPSGIGKTAFLTAALTGAGGLKHGPRILGNVVMSFRRPVYVCQTDVLFPYSNIETNLLHLTGCQLADAFEFIPEAFIPTFVSRRAESPIGLSGGERKALIVARALLRGPDCIVLDESFTSLDVESRKAIATIIDRYHAATGSSVVTVSHQMEDFVLLADRVYPVRATAELARMDAAIELTDAKRKTEWHERVADVSAILYACGD